MTKLLIGHARELIEALWADLSRNSDALESPEWHREAL